jgi:hypothetical protein
LYFYDSIKLLRIDVSIAASGEIFGHVLGELVAVTGVLALTIGHDSSLVPHTNDDSLCGSNDAGTTTTFSGEVNGVVLSIVLDEHVLLVGDSDTSLRALSVALGGLEDTLEFIDGDLLLGSIFLREIVLIGVECKPGGSSPGVSIVTIDGSKLVDTSHCVLLLGVVELINNLMEICVPA